MNKYASRSHWTSNSFSNSSLLCPDRFRTSQMVIVEEDAHRIDERLDEAETRLRMLSINTKSSVKELKKMFGTVEKKARSSSRIRGRSTYGKHNPDSHIQVIRHHLHLLEEHMQDENYDPNQCAYDSIHEKSIEPMQDLRNISSTKGFSLKSRQVQHKHQQDVKQLLNTIDKLRENIKQLEETIALQSKEHRQEISELKIHYEHYYLTKQDELVKEIECLEVELSRQKEDQCLKVVVDRLAEENTALKESARIERALKVQFINKSKELDSQIKIMRANNQQFLTQIIQLKNTLQSNAKDTLCICQTILYATEILNRISNSELLATVVMIKQELNIKKSMIKSIVNTLKDKYSIEGYDLTGKSTFRLKQDHNKFRKFINGDDRQTTNEITTVGKQLLPTARQDVQLQVTSTSPFLDDMTEIMSTENAQLYMMLLLQATKIEQMLVFRGYQ